MPVCHSMFGIFITNLFWMQPQLHMVAACMIQLVNNSFFNLPHTRSPVKSRSLTVYASIYMYIGVHLRCAFVQTAGHAFRELILMANSGVEGFYLFRQIISILTYIFVLLILNIARNKYGNYTQIIAIFKKKQYLKSWVDKYVIIYSCLTPCKTQHHLFCELIKLQIYIFKCNVKSEWFII